MAKKYSTGLRSFLPYKQIPKGLVLWNDYLWDPESGDFSLTSKYYQIVEERQKKPGLLAGFELSTVRFIANVMFEVNVEVYSE